MTLLWCDGFEGYGDTDAASLEPSGVMADKYAATFNEGQWKSHSSDSRTDWALEFSQYGIYEDTLRSYDLDTTSNTLIAGVAVRYKTVQDLSNPHYWPVLAFMSDSNNENAVLVYCNGCLHVRGPDYTYLGGTRILLEVQNYYYIEMKVYSHATNGEVHVKINNCPVLSLTSVNTLDTVGKPSVKVQIGDSKDIEGSRELLVDDFYVCDDSGNTNNDFLGPVIVKTLWPASDDTAEWATTGNANTSNHYEQVNLLARDDATDYVEDDTIGNEDRYGTDSLSIAFDTIYACVTWGALLTDNDSTNNCAFTLTSNGTTVNGGTVDPPTSTRIYPHIVESEPSTNNAWTTGTINSALIGVEVK